MPERKRKGEVVRTPSGVREQTVIPEKTIKGLEYRQVPYFAPEICLSPAPDEADFETCNQQETGYSNSKAFASIFQ